MNKLKLEEPFEGPFELHVIIEWMIFWFVFHVMQPIIPGNRLLFQFIIFSTKASPVHQASTIVRMNPNNGGGPLVSSSGENPVVKPCAIH